MEPAPKHPYLTLGLIALLGVIYSLASFGSEDPFELVRFGASVPALVVGGQWERLVSANFVHSFAAHYLVNALSLYSLGTLIELQLGRVRFLAIYLASGIAGAAGSVLMARGPMSVGASTAIFGLLGGFAAMHLRYRGTLSEDVRQTGRWWAVILLLNGGLSLLVPQIDASAHVGGFFGGLVMAFIVMSRAVDEPPSLLAKIISAALIVITLTAGQRTVMRAFSDEWPDDVFAAKSAFVVNESADFAQLNELAWMSSIDPNASPRDLELAVTAAERAVELSQRHPVVLDTLAQAVHRLGQNTRAVALEKEALRGDPMPVFATQLSRFLLAEKAPENSPDTPTLKLVGSTLVARTSSCAQGFLLGEYRGRVAWVAQVFVASGGEFAAPPTLTSRFAPDVSTRFVGVTESCEIEAGTDVVRAAFWARDYQVDLLP